MSGCANCREATRPTNPDCLDKYPLVRDHSTFGRRPPKSRRCDKVPWLCPNKTVETHGTGTGTLALAPAGHGAVDADHSAPTVARTDESTL